MLTDDDLTRQLGAAFRGTTDDLAYTGRIPTPRRPAYVLAVPAAATVAAAAVLVVAGTGVGDDPAAPEAAPTRSAAPGTAGAPLVTDRVEVAGFTFSYRHVAGDARVDDLYGVMDPGGVPEDARAIEAPEGARAWVGTYGESGDNALFVEAPTRNGGQLFAIASPTWSTDQLADLFHNGSSS